MTDLRHGPDPLHGFWSVTANPIVLEAAGSLRPDFVSIDLQHGANFADLSTTTFTALAYYKVPAIVRVATNAATDIGHVLDLGAAGVMVPMVDTPDDAFRASQACRYAPDGTRSYGIKTPRLDPTSPAYQPICAVQIETAAGVDNADAIAATAGVDWLYVGPADLGLSLGGIQAGDILSVFDGSHPLSKTVGTAFEQVVAAARKHGKRAGLHCSSAAAALVAKEHGFTVFSVATDVVEMRTGMDEQLSAVRGALD
jgi:4-hydroxy-2-oxoheptanedioate aldolase